MSFKFSLDYQDAIGPFNSNVLTNYVLYEVWKKRI